MSQSSALFWFLHLLIFRSRCRALLDEINKVFGLCKLRCVRVWIGGSDADH